VDHRQRSIGRGELVLAFRRIPGVVDFAAKFSAFPTQAAEDADAGEDAYGESANVEEDKQCAEGQYQAVG
jgi:hypothetical protein